MEVQIFGIRNDADTRKALRFFSDRRVKTHFVDLKQRAASRGELRRFVERFGADSIIDRDSKRFRELGLASAYYGAERWLDILAEEPLVLKTPLVRWQGRLSAGVDEAAWKEWVEQGR